MLTIISGTNRKGSYTRKVAENYGRMLDRMGVEHRFFSLEDIPGDLLAGDMYTYNTNPGIVKIQDEVLKPMSKFILVFPEYNGSFPGVLKAFIDSSDIAKCWHNKKACLVGVADGRAGNLRGMEHMTNILNHMRINVLHMKIPISRVGQVVDEDGDITVPETLKLMEQQARLFIEF